MSWCVLAYKSRNITVVESGGALFTTFLDQMASPVSHELWARHRSSVRRHGDSVLDSTEFAAIRQREHGKFYGWLVFATSNVKPQSRKHMFLQTFSAKYHGLSRLGQKILGHFGLLMKHTQYDRMETQEVIAQRKEIRCTVLCLHVIVRLLILPFVATLRKAATSSGWTTSQSIVSSNCRYQICKQERITRCCGRDRVCDAVMFRSRWE